MSKEAQGMWETIPDSDKTIILKASTPKNTNLSIYLHESEYGNDTDDADDGIDALIDAASNDDGGSTELLAHVTKQNAFAKTSGNATTPPSDIRKVYLLISLVVVLMVPDLFNLNSM
jgi:hypothetical protein